MCSKKIYHFYYCQIKKLRVKADIEVSNISNIKFDKNGCFIELDLEGYKNI